MKTSFQIPITHSHDAYISENEDFDEVALLLHGFQLDGYFMFKRYAKKFGERTKVVSPNAPFLVPLKKGTEWSPRYGWYFYDASKKSFYINYDPAAIWLRDLMKKINPEGKKTTVIGYSQGGYIAPKAAELIPETRKVIGINSIFRSERFKVRPEVAYHQVNGSLDEIVSPQEAREEYDKMSEQNPQGKFLLVEAEHPLNRTLVDKSLELL